MARAASRKTASGGRWRSLYKRGERAFEYLTRHGWVPVFALLLAGIGALAFLSLADEVVEGETTSFDEKVFRFVAGRYQTLGPFGQEAWRDLTALGGSTVISLLVAGVTIFLLLRRQWRSAGFLAASVVGGLIISSLLKWAIDRARPDLFEHGSHTMTASFPSGHSTNAAVAYLAIAILLTKLVESVRMKLFILVAGLAVPVLVGFSRVALAVHWPTDVIGGWLIGLAWGLLVYAAATYMQEHGTIEQEGEMAEAK